MCAIADTRLTTSALAEKIQAKIDLAIALALYSWTSLTIAVQNSFGGPDAAEKRDWFAGQISELLASESDADVDYLEEFMIGVMNDNFDVHIDDGSAEEVAAKIIGLKKLCLQGDFGMVDEMYDRWSQKQKNGGEKRIAVQHVERDEDDDEDWDNEDNDDDEDVEMEEAPELVRVPKEKVVPKTDDDGFTEVIGKKRK